jgi:hypothetical protein
MFLENSRYADMDQVTVTTPGGREVAAVKLRRLPATSGTPYTVTGTDRLDSIAVLRYEDATRYWHIADANSELEAADLIAQPGRVIRVPVQ